MKRKFLKILGWTLAVACGLFLLALMTVDFWAPTVIRPILAEQGVTFDEITKVDGHYLLTDVAYTGEGMEAEIGELQIPTLWRLASKRWLGNEDETIVFINAGQLTLLPSDETYKVEEKEASEPASLPRLATDALSYWDLAFEWVDFIETNNFELLTEPDGRPFNMDLSASEDGISLNYFKETDEATGKGDLTAVAIFMLRRNDGGLEFEAISPKYSVQSISQIKVSDSLSVEGWAQYAKQQQRLDFSAIWGPEGYIPDSAHAEATDFVLPAVIYEVPDYEQPSITLRADWDGAKADVDLNATAAPKDKDLPPLKVALKALGDDQIVNVEQFNAEAWSSKIALSKPLRVDINNLKDLPDAELNVDLNLSDIPEKRIDGRLQGALVVDHQPGAGWPLLTADFAGQSLRYEELQLSKVDVRAQLDYPVLTVEALNVSTGEGTELTVAGVADMEEETITESEVKLSADGAFLEALAPVIGEQDFAFQSLLMQVSASGPWATPKHAGELSLNGFKFETGLAMKVAADWEADWLKFSALALSVSNARSGVDLTGKASLEGAERAVTIDTARIDVREQPELTLQAPFTVRVAEQGEVSISAMEFLSEAGGHLTLEGQMDYPRAGYVRLLAQDVSAEWLDLVLEQPLEYKVKLDEFELSAKWDEGPLSARLLFDGGLLPDDQPELELIADIVLTASQLQVPALRLVQGDFTLLEAKGEAPLVVTPAGETLWSLDGQSAVDLTLKAEPDDSPIWNQLENQMEIDFIRPALDFKIAGSVDAPTGHIAVQFDALETLSTAEDARKLPRVEQGDFQIALAPDRIALESGKVLLSDQPLSIQAESPMDRQSWKALLAGEPPDWRQSQGELNFTDVPLKAFKDWLPDALRDEGDLSLTASLKPGEVISGSLDFDEVSTRPLAQLGSINDIHAAFRMDGRTLRVEEAEARIGGAPLSVTGQVVLDEQWRPQYDLQMVGESIPLARSPGLVLRGTPDITLKTEAGVTTLGGKLTLNESFFTMDLAAFQDSGGGASQGGGGLKPPFFSVEDEPLASWRLKLTLQGDRFLRVRVPAFEGVVSADFQLRGSLKSPLMHGAAELQQGVVMFPFATLRLDEGWISIGQNEPSIIKLDVSASGRAYGYDLLMRVTGTANEPVVSFTSTPSLEQSDILLMVTSGQIPQHARSTESRLSGIAMYLGRSVLVDWGLIDPLDDTLTVNVGEDVTTQGKDTINIRYQISDDWAAVGAYDKYDAYYLDFEWTIYED